MKEVVKLTDDHMRKRTQPDKSIITLDAACAWHNMFRGEDRTLSMEAVHMMVAKETGLHPGALSDNVYAKGETFDPTKMAVQTGARILLIPKAASVSRVKTRQNNHAALRRKIVRMISSESETGNRWIRFDPGFFHDGRARSESPVSFAFIKLRGKSSTRRIF